jgi:hypothetical protein
MLPLAVRDLEMLPLTCNNSASDTSTWWSSFDKSFDAAISPGQTDLVLGVVRAEVGERDHET